MGATVFEIAWGSWLDPPLLVKGVGTKRLGKRRVNLILVGGGGKKEKAPAPESTSAIYHARAMKLSRERALVKNFSKRQKN